MAPTTTAPDSIADVVKSAGSDWVYRLSGTPEQVDAHLIGRMIAVDDAAAERFPDGSVRITPQTLSALSERSAHAARAVIEQLYLSTSPQMVVMVWRLLHGAEVERVDLSFESAVNFHLRIVLRVGRSEIEETYESDNIADAKLVRHFGASKMNGTQPVFLGFYPTVTLGE